ncbi:MAG: hypothetical protein R8G66_01285 [Cytophagales bacterium]|nr:hypothetical protein [Cytophagales bacterium]
MSEYGIMEFLENVSVNGSSLEPLPIFHSSNSNKLELILRSKDVKPGNNSDLCFFYGTAAYFDKTQSEKTSAKRNRMPICIVFDEIDSLPINQIAPFDTGAFRDGLYETHDIHEEECPLKHFLIRVDKDSISKFIITFYGSNEKYLSCEPVNELGHNEFNYPVENYFKMINEQTDNADYRKSTIELQLNKPIKFDEKSPIALVLPGFYEDSEDKMKQLNQIVPSENIRFYEYNPNKDSIRDANKKMIDVVDKMVEEQWLK